MWWKIALLGLVIRLTAIYFVSRNDNYYDGVFKIIHDVDYKVYLDATLEQSPYDRHTYRYSPILAMLVAPSYELHQLFGKVLMACFDVLAMFFIYKIFEHRGKDDPTVKLKAAKLATYFYSLNPALIYVTVRGSCEGITMALASAFWYFYVGGDCHGNMSPVERLDRNVPERQPNQLKKYLSYAIFGLWVHFRVYPIIFVPMLIMHEYHAAKQNKLRKAIAFTVQFGLVSGGVFLGLALYFYCLYGFQFLNSTYLYHFTRRDNRHSKSVYFYEVYLNYANDSIKPSFTRIINRLLPSIMAIFTVSYVLSKKRSLFFCYALITFYFVIFNRVITDQYYMWALCSMYFVIPEMEGFRQKKWKGVVMRLIKDQLITPLPVFLWLMMTLKMEQVAPGIYLYHVWYCSIFILGIHIMLVTRYFTEIIPYSFEDQRKRNLQMAKAMLGNQKKRD